MNHILLKSIFLKLLVLVSLSVVHAESRALLVGVSNYPTLEERWSLAGPKNDVTRLKQVLLTRDFKAEDIIILADGVNDAQSPTRANIINALKQLVKSATSGDVIFIYFAGHGSQMPIKSNSSEGQQEPDGLHEIFLPIDIGKWDGSQGHVENAIVDYEVRSLVDQILDRGAFVWGVFDTCHSATMVRGGQPSEVKLRHINPEQLGMSGDLISASTRTYKNQEVKSRGGSGSEEVQSPLGALKINQELKTSATRSSDKPQSKLNGRSGGSVFFYAAQTFELAPEIRLPIGDPQRKPYGLFSYMITNALELGTPMSYRQLMQYVLTQYAGIQQVRVTPVMTGTSPDQLVFGDSKLKLRQWPINEPDGQISVGTLSGVGVGDLFAVVPDPTSKTEETLGYMRVRSAELNSARLESVEYQGKAPLSLSDFKSGTYARVFSSQSRISLRVQIDQRSCGATCPWKPLIDKMKSDPLRGVNVKWVSESPDVILRVSAKAVAIASPTAYAGRPCPEIGVDCKGALPPLNEIRLVAYDKVNPDTLRQDFERVELGLHRVSRAQNLMRIAAQMRDVLNRSGLMIKLMHQPAQGGSFKTIAPQAISPVRDGDRVKIKLKNQGRRPVDVTIFYLDAEYGISPIFPSRGELNRFQPGESHDVSIRVSKNENISGREHLVILTDIPQAAGVPPIDFSVLTQRPLQGIKTRGGSYRAMGKHQGLKSLLEASFTESGVKTRGARTEVNSDTSVQVFSLDLRD